MKSYRFYKNEIAGFESVSDMVKTVEKIAASRLHFLKQAVTSLNFYTESLVKTLSRLQVFYKSKSNPLIDHKAGNQNILIILTGDEGLVGGLWHNLVETLMASPTKYESIVVVGSKGMNYLVEENIIVNKSFTGLSDSPTEAEIKPIADYIFAEFKKGHISKVDILYPKYISLAEQHSQFIQFLPFDFATIKTETDKLSPGFPVFEPAKKNIFDNLLKKYIKVFFHKVIIETKLSELSARTITTEHATEKTKDLIKGFNLDYTKNRHRAITQKQLESFATHKTV